MGLNVKVPRAEASVFSQLLFYFNTLLLGALVAILVVLRLAVTDLQESHLKALQVQERMLAVIEENLTWQDVVTESLHDAESRFTRMEHMMHIPRGSRLEIAKEYDQE